MLAMPGGGKMMRENVATTSAEAERRSVVELTPSRSLKVYVLPSGRRLPALGRSGMIVAEARQRRVEAHQVVVPSGPGWRGTCPGGRRGAPLGGPAHLSTPPRLGFGSAARRLGQARTAARAGAGCFSDHAVSAAPAVVPAAVLRKRRRFLAAEAGLVHVANPPLGWHAATLRARTTVVNRPRPGYRPVGLESEKRLWRHQRPADVRFERGAPVDGAHPETRPDVPLDAGGEGPQPRADADQAS